MNAPTRGPQNRRMPDLPEPTPLFRFRVVALPCLAALTVAAVLCLFHYVRHVRPGILSPDAMDTVQCARYLARTGNLGTNIIRPLLTQSLSAHGDGTLPDLAHPPLHLALCAIIMRVSHHTIFGYGDQDAILVSLACFVASIAACYLLYVRCFGPRGAFWACLLYGMGGIALSAALSARPTTLAALLTTVLFIALFNADVQPAPEEVAGPEEEARKLKRKRQSFRWSVFAGVVFGLLYLSVYSTLILLPVVLVYLWLIAGRRAGPVAGFLLAALVVAAPVLWHSLRATGFPFYNTRLIELVMNTDTFPGYSLYRASATPIPLGQYLASGGIMEIARKAGSNLLGFYGRIPDVWGGVLLTLTLGSLLTRFADRRVNRVRGLLWAAVAVHVLGLSLFQGYEETAPLLLMYAPVAAVLGVGFLLSVVRARNLPRFYRHLIVGGWMTFGAIPGVLQLTALPPTVPPVSPLYLYLNNDAPQMQVARRTRQFYLISDAPWEMAFRCDYPAVWLPQNSDVIDTITQRTGHPSDGVMLAGDVRSYDENDIIPWKQLYSRLAAVSQFFNGMDAPTREIVRRQIRLYYPQELTTFLNTFAPQRSPGTDELNYSLVLWNSTPAPVVKPRKAK